MKDEDDIQLECLTFKSDEAGMHDCLIFSISSCERASTNGNAITLQIVLQKPWQRFFKNSLAVKLNYVFRM